MEIPIELQIRKVIFEKFNDVNLRFNNDEIFEILQKQGLASSVTIDDMEPYFKEICDKGLVRNIAQNFTTMWFKLFEPVEQFHCAKCNYDVYLAKNEDRICPNPNCRVPLG